ncbi:hypothetical protein [Halorussus caseinilyticus]|uniref:Uncharacterized protein n=1 Tax=Halorussus caseinilyticus TaxID=3034025 RepID=A0ABD5WPV0_9EURY|nr:hypothetical protein [Halorussus sp. DT72]
MWVSTGHGHGAVAVRLRSRTSDSPRARSAVGAPRSRAEEALEEAPSALLRG